MKKPNRSAAQIWADIEDHLVPAFNLMPSERAVYFFLVRKSRLAGKRVLRIPARGLSRATRLSRSTIRTVFRRLVAKNILNLFHRDRRGFELEVKLPREIPGCIQRTREWDGRDLEARDFRSANKYRGAIYRREDNRCFYCRRRLSNRLRVLDHVVPRSRGGSDSYRNLVACCLDCNMAKRDFPVADFLRTLYRDARLTTTELHARLAALKALTAGKLKPILHLARP